MHSRTKMRYYRLSEAKVKSVLRKPDRREEGIAPRTVAQMQKSGTKKNPTEIWIMYQTAKSKQRQITKIISAWRYPGQTPLGRQIFIPEDTLWELEKIKDD